MPTTWAFRPNQMCEVFPGEPFPTDALFLGDTKNVAVMQGGCGVRLGSRAAAMRSFADYVRGRLEDG